MARSVVPCVSVTCVGEWKIIFECWVALEISILADSLSIDIITTVNHSHLDHIMPLHHLPSKCLECWSKVPAVATPASVELNNPGVLFVGDCVVEVCIIEDDNIVTGGVESNRSVISDHRDQETKQYLQH